MRKKNIEKIIQKAEDLSTATDNLLNCLSRFEDENGQAFSLKRIIPSTDSSVSQIVSRIHGVQGIIAEFKKSRDPNLTPLSYLTNLEQALDESISAINDLINRIENVMNAQGGLRSFNYDNFHALAKNGNSQNLQSHFQNIQNTSEALLKRFFECVHILKPRSSYSFQAASNSLAGIIDNTQEKITRLNKIIKNININENELIETSQKAISNLDEIKRLKSDSDSDRKTIAEYLAQSTQEKANIDSISADAEKLQATVKNYQSTFDQFQELIDKRNALFDSGTEKLNNLIVTLEKQQNDVESLINRSESMLSSATIAGLAANFSNMMDKLTKELRWARITFYFGIVLLMISAVPLLAFVIMPLLSPILQSIYPDLMFPTFQYTPSAADNGWHYLGQILARIVILLPAAWFVSFAAIRHSSLFRLREHYAYKYSMAVSVEGFKQQAPLYEQEIAALVLEQLAFNPTDKLIPSKDIREGKAPSIANYLLERIRAKTEEKSTT